MSKQVYLLRHAKSSWADGKLSDRERGLNNRGRRDAPRMGKALSRLLAPHSILASPAQRAQLTLGGLQDGWPALQDFPHRREEALYTFAAADLVNFIRRQDDGETSLFIIGHNPALTDLVNWVCGETILANLPTAGFVQLSLGVACWGDLVTGCGRLHQRVFPKELGET